MRSRYPMIIALFVASFMMFRTATYAQSYWVAEKVAGVPGSETLATDGSPASTSPIGFGKAITFDDSGLLYFTAGDVSKNCRVIQIDLINDSYQNVVGNNAPGHGGSICNSPLVPTALGIAGELEFYGDDLYFVEFGFGGVYGNRLRKVDFAADEICDAIGNGIQNSDDGTGFIGFGSATTISINSPIGMEVHGDEVYWQELSCIRKMKLSDSTIQMVAGSLNGFSWVNPPPLDVPVTPPYNFNARGAFCLDAAGDIYYGTLNNTINKITFGADTVITVVVGKTDEPGFDGDGNATDKLISTAFGMKFHPSNGLLYFCDYDNGLIRTYDPSNGQLTTLFGEGADLYGVGSLYYNGDKINADSVRMNPSDLAWGPGGELYVYDDFNYVIREFYPCTEPQIVGVGDVPFVCPGDEFDVSIDASLNDALAWNWIADACNGTDLVAVGEDVKLTMPNDEASIFIVSDTTGNCVLEPVCLEVVLSPMCTFTNNTITPNGDNLNDYLEIDVVNEYPDNNLYVYNRYGVEVNVIENYDNIENLFDGTSYDGGELPGGSYYYIFEEVNPTDRSPIADRFYGWIHILR